MDEEVKCEICGEPMPQGEEMFTYHGYSGPCPKPPLSRPAPGLSLSDLRAANVRRCEDVFHKLDHWTPTDWACAMAGEAGEACNAVKKLRRIADGTNTAKDPQTEAEAVHQIGCELADTIIYADLLAARLGIDLSEYIRCKFNEVSERMNSTVCLGEAT